MPLTHRQYFNDLAPRWNEMTGDGEELDALLKDLPIRSGEIILDVGAGTGRLSRYLLKRLNGRGLVLAQDFACRMLKEGKRLTREPRCLWICDDIHALSLQSGILDRIICYSAFPHFFSPVLALKEMFRVLRPGGCLLVLHTQCSRDLNAFHASLDGPVSKDKLPPVEVLTRMMRAAGFQPLSSIETKDLYRMEARKPE
ncbi:MAG TPA: class I SAM-dependent methyltransferase [bacterium]|nr:class I SAM-dependent methyltransferase [bacterium]